jgi:hypothetical protein
MDPRMPTRERLLGALEGAYEQIKRNTPVFAKPSKPLPDEEKPDHEYGQARMDLIKGILSKRIEFNSVPDKLLTLADRFPSHSDALVREAATWAEHASARHQVGSEPRPSDSIATGPDRAPAPAQLTFATEPMLAPILSADRVLGPLRPLPDPGQFLATTPETEDEEDDRPPF